MKIRELIPQSWRPLLRGLRQRSRAAFYASRSAILAKSDILPRRYCPVCNTFSPRFQDHPINGRARARCPCCGSLERHRLVHRFFTLKHEQLLRPNSRMLHFAPEQCLVPYFQSIPLLEYESADLNGKKAHLAIDITDMPLPDRAFDLVLCGHVLEHVSDDTAAMSELYRILSPAGSAVVLVPIGGTVTYEDPRVTDPEERARLFGQHDHVRRYGLDIKTRLSAAGFHVQLYSLTDIAGDNEIGIMGLDCPGCREIFLCRKE